MDRGSGRADLRRARRLGEIHAPTLIVHGRADAMVPVEPAKEIAAGIPGSRLAVLEDCGHWPHVERRAEFVEAVRQFLGLEEPSPRRGLRPPTGRLG